MATKPVKKTITQRIKELQSIEAKQNEKAALAKTIADSRKKLAALRGKK